MAKKISSPVFYVTNYSVKGQGRQYRTKTLTDFHAHIRATYGGTTMKCDPSVSWPFGLYAEVVENSPRPTAK